MALTVLIFSLQAFADDGDNCHDEVLTPDGLIRDGFNTADWVDSIFWQTPSKNSVIEGDRAMRTFSCDTAFVNVVGQPGRPGDYAVFQNTFGFDQNDFPNTMAQFEFTLETTDLVQSYGHGDSFSLFRVYQDENDLNTVMLNVELIRVNSFTKPGTKPIAGNYWLMEMSFINQKDGSTFIAYHPIQGDQADVFYRWDAEGKVGNSYLSITDESGVNRYDNKVPDYYNVVPRINRLGMVDAATPFAIGDQIVLRGPMPRNQ